MIGKSIPNTRKSGSKRSRVSSLMTYMENPENANKEEKCVYSNHRGFLNDNQQSRIAEMIALSEESRSSDPIEHIVFSWQESEIPTDENIEQLIDVLLEQTKMKDHQIVYALHKDTDNLHLHVMINRVNPLTGKAKHFEWKLNEILKVCAVIEHEQNWKTETNAVYRILDGKMKDMRSPSSSESRKKTVNGKVRDTEVRTGEKSALRQAQEQAIPILQSTKDWQNLHERLAKIGMEYEKKGSGALIFVGGVPVKASDVGSPYTLSKMQKRLGEYQPPRTGLKIAQAQKEPLDRIAKDLGWHDYKIARESNKAGRKIKKEALDSTIRSERQDLFLRHQKDRQEIFKKWTAGRDLLNAMRSTVALKHAQEKAEMIDRQKILRKRFQTENPSMFPSFENWLQVTKGKEAAELYRKAYVAEVHGPIDSIHAPVKNDIRNYDPVVIRKEVQYKNRSNGQTDFVDVGAKIKFLNRSDDAVLAGLQLCQQRFGKNLTLYGSEDFKKQAVKIAVANRITIANPELQEEIFKLEGQLLRRDRLIDRFSKMDLVETDETKKERKTANNPGF